MKKKLMFGFIAVMLVAGTVLAGCAKPAPAEEAPTAEPIVLIYSTFCTKEDSSQQNVEWWLAEFEKRTEGRVKIDRYYNEALLGAHETIVGTAEGIADIGFIPPAYEPAKLPLSQIGDWPGLGAPSPWVRCHANMEMMRTYRPLQEEFERLGVKLLGLPSTDTLMGIATTEKQVKTLEDLSGLKLRAYGYGAKIMKALGVVAVGMPATEIYTSLQLGTIDGCFWWPSSIINWKADELMNYYALNTGLDASLTTSFFMNPDTYNSLPGDVKAVIEDLEDEWAEPTAKVGGGLQEEAFDTLKKAGITFYYLTDEERARWVEKVDVPKLHAEWAKEVSEKYGVAAEEYLSKFRELLKKYEPLDPTT